MIGDGWFYVQFVEFEGSELVERGKVVVKSANATTRIGIIVYSKEVCQRTDIAKEPSVRWRDVVQPRQVVVLVDTDVGEKQSPARFKPRFRDQ